MIFSVICANINSNDNSAPNMQFDLYGLPYDKKPSRLKEGFLMSKIQNFLCGL